MLVFSPSAGWLFRREILRRDGLFGDFFGNEARSKKGAQGEEMSFSKNIRLVEISELLEITPSSPFFLRASF